LLWNVWPTLMAEWDSEGNMPQSKDADPSGGTLGMGSPIPRRDFMNSTLLASGATLLGGLTPRQLLAKEEWTGYGGIGDYARSNGNTYEIVHAGHQMRDGVFAAAEAADTGESFDCVVVGGGISGLAAALFFQRHDPKLTCLVLENHPVFGGEAKRNEFVLGGRRLAAPQGSDHFGTPAPGSFFAEYYDRIGIDPSQFEYQAWDGRSPEIPVGHSFEFVQDPYGFFFGAKFGQRPGMWLIDPWTKQLAGAPISGPARAELLNYQKLHKPMDSRGVLTPEMDRITMEAFMMERYGLGRETIRAFFTPGPGDPYGIGPDVLSACCWGGGAMNRGLGAHSHAFPGGNDGIARHMVKTLIPAAIPGPRTLPNVCLGNIDFSALDRPGQPARIRLGSTVTGVKHEGDAEKSRFVSVTYTRGGKLYRLRARAVVMAGGSWTTKHVVLDLPAAHRDAYGQFYRSPCMVANIALRNWRFLYKLGISGGYWFEGMGCFAAIRKQPTFATRVKTIGPDSPVVLTVKVLFCRPGLTIQEQGDRGRAEILATPFRQYELKLREQLTEMFGPAGFDARRDVAGIILNRWGHAYGSPQPGFFFGLDGKPAPRDILRQSSFGRIAFANTDLSGDPSHTTSITEAERAGGQLLDGALRG
jgi:spermidine dehydrogenase